jgi:IS5 family transposase
MLVLYGEDQMNLFESMMPEELFALSDELKQIDAFLDDERFLAPFIEKHNKRIGRPTVAVQTYIRMMYLKFRYQLGYETLVKEVSDSIMWRRFCRIPLNEKVCDSTTLIKLTQKYGPEMTEDINKALIDKAKDEKIVRGRKMRLDTTVVEANVHYPTDASILADAVKVISKTVKKIKGAQDIKTRFVDKTRTVKKGLLSITKTLRKRSGEAYSEVRKITRDVLKVAEDTVKSAKNVLSEITESASFNYKLNSAIELTEKIIEQTKRVEAREKIEGRIVSFFDPDARPIRKGKLGKDTEFGYKVLIVESENAVITGYDVFTGNPADKTLLINALEEHKERFAHAPTSATTDRGFYSQDNEDKLKSMGVKKISIPKCGKISAERKAYQNTSTFKRLQRFRAGSEATISLLKRKYGLRRSLSKGIDGTKSWVGFGVFARNLQRIAVIKSS